MTCVTSGTIAVTCYCEISVRFNAVDSHRGAEMTPKFKVSLSVQEMQRSCCIQSAESCFWDGCAWKGDFLEQEQRQLRGILNFAEGSWNAYEEAF